MLRREFGKLKRKHRIIKKEENRIEKTIQSTINQFWMDQENKGNKVTNSLNTFNPLTSHLYFKISFIFFKIFISNYIQAVKNQQFIIKQRETKDQDKEEAENQDNQLAKPESGTSVKEKEKVLSNMNAAVDTVNQNIQENQQLLLRDNAIN
jgi:hypothetical protein